MRAAMLVLAVLLAPGGTRAADAVPDPGYPWTHDVRPVVHCYDDDWGRLLNPLCRATGVRRVPRTTLEPLDPARRLEFGERYDPARYLECRKHAPPRALDCEVYRLRRNELPVHFPYPGVPLPRLPGPPKDSGFRPGMSSQEYFDHLCRTEAGEFIYRTVEGVEGVFQMRPRVAASNLEWRDRYVMPDPYGQGSEYVPGMPAIFLAPGAYRFYETTLFQEELDSTLEKSFHPSLSESPPDHFRYYRFTREEGESDLRTLARTPVTELHSNYGYFWRDINRHLDRTLGIAGGEMTVVDLRSNEVLAIWRGFLRGGNSKRVWWPTATSCPRRTAYTSDNFAFLKRVLIPIKD